MTAKQQNWLIAAGARLEMVTRDLRNERPDNIKGFLEIQKQAANVLAGAKELIGKALNEEVPGRFLLSRRSG